MILVPRRIRHALLALALGCYNAAASVLLLLLMWRNGLWNERRWAGARKDDPSAS